MTLLNMSIYGAVIILAIILIRIFTLHKLPKKLFLILWGIALLRLLVPFEISSSFSIYSLLPQRPATELTPEHQEQSYSELPTDFGPNPMLFPEVPEFMEPEIQTTETGTANTFNFSRVLSLVHIIGTLLFGFYFLFAYLKCYREFRTSLPVKESFATEWLEKHPLRRTISIRQSDLVSTPLTYGVFRPVILLPKTMDWGNHQQTDYILFHEFTHIRRFDQVAKLFMIGALCLHWFNPFVWVMYYLFNRDIELSCDEIVLQHTQEDRSSYAMALIHMEENRTHTAPLFSHFSENAIEERIVAIMKMQKVTFGISLFSILLVLAVIVTLATTAKAAEEDPTTHPLPSITSTPGPTSTPPPTATPSPTPDPGPTVTPIPVPAIPDGTYAAMVKGCTEDMLFLDFVEYITDSDTKRKAELIELLDLSVEHADLDTNGNFINGYYIYDADSIIVTCPIADDIQIRLINRDSGSVFLETDQLAVFLNRIFTEYGWSRMPYFFKIQDGIILEINEYPIP